MGCDRRFCKGCGCPGLEQVAVSVGVWYLSCCMAPGAVPGTLRLTAGTVTVGMDGNRLFHGLRARQDRKSTRLNSSHL